MSGVNGRRAGAVAAGHPATAEAAAEILAEGGNAFDAVVAGLLAACAAEPVLTSLGGGGFLLAQPASGPARLFDFFAQTPRRRQARGALDFHPIEADFGTARQEFHIGLGSAAVPGVVRGLFEIRRSQCRLPMRRLVEPACTLAREGVRINAMQAHAFGIVAPIYRATPEARAVFCDADGEVPGEGALLRQPLLAEVLEFLASEGDRAFYEGDIAELIARLCAEHGLLDREALASYRVILREPLAVDYRGWRLLTNPPPASGGLLVALGLRLAEAVTTDGAPDLETLVEVMAETETCRREGLATSSGLPALDDALIARHARDIEGRLAARRGTTHLSVMDADGNCAGLTASNGEGCGHLIPDTGIMLNNMLGEADLNPHGFHQWTPDTRLTSMMAPGLLVAPEGERVVLGSGGSNRIRTALLQVISRLIDQGLPLEAAVLHPRVHPEGGHLDIEGGFAPEEVERLLRHWPDHRLWPGSSLFFGGVHAVARRGQGFEAAADPRREGAVRIVG